MALTRTGVIKFNVKERGRKHLGQDRCFDTAVLAQLVNSPAVQERVALGDLHGFYGHWPRTKFGMEPMEGGVIGGKHVALEPAVRTVYLKGFPDGTIEHEQEFLDSVPGRLAERLFKSKAGGFSSAIVAPKRGASQVPQSFHGFDYVLEPNFTVNRGYALDGVGLSDEDCAVLDEVAQYNSLLDSTNILFDRIQGDYDRLDAVAHQLELENIELKAMLTRKGGSQAIVLDGVLEVVTHSKRNRYDTADEFANAELAGYEKPKRDEPELPPSAADKYIAKRFR